MGELTSLEQANPLKQHTKHYKEENFISNNII